VERATRHVALPDLSCVRTSRSRAGRVKSRSILSAASRAVRSRRQIPNSAESDGARASCRNDPTSSYLGAPSCLARTALGKRRGWQASAGKGEGTPIRTLAGLNGPRLMRHKRLILKNSARDKPFRWGAGSLDLASRSSRLLAPTIPSLLPLGPWPLHGRQLRGSRAEQIETAPLLFIS